MSPTGTRVTTQVFLFLIKTISFVESGSSVAYRLVQRNKLLKKFNGTNFNIFTICVPILLQNQSFIYPKNKKIKKSILQFFIKIIIILPFFYFFKFTHLILESNSKPFNLLKLATRTPDLSLSSQQYFRPLWSIPFTKLIERVEAHINTD